MSDDPLISARALVKRFGEFVAVDGIDVEVQRGEAFGFLGPNGAGKSSTMRMIGCTSPVTSGHLRVLGMDPATQGRHIRARLGVVPQADQLDNELTVEENLVIYGRYFDIPRAECRRRAAELLEFVQLNERASSKVEPLSGGMKRRVTIARSLINEPELLLLDEPTTGLDPQARHVLWDRLYRLKQDGVTLVLTTHYMDEAEQLCDRLVVLDKGRIVAAGSPRELIATHSTREVLELRFEAGANEAAAPSMEGIGERDRGVAGPHPRLRPRRREGAGDGSRSRGRAGERAGPSQQPRGRLPAAHRPQPHRLSAMSTPAAVRVWETNMAVYRRIWRSNLLGSFVQPFLYLLGMGVGVGSLVDRSAASEALLGGVDYVSFLAPALIATTAMMVAAQESMWPVMEGFMWTSSYRAMAATPIAPREVAAGVTLWLATRAALSADGCRRRPGPLPGDAVVGARAGGGLRRADRVGGRAADHGVVVESRSRPLVPGDHAVRDRPDVPLRRRLLPDRSAPRLAAARGLRHPAVPRRRAVPGCRARHAGAGRDDRAPRRAGRLRTGRVPRVPRHVRQEVGVVSERSRRRAAARSSERANEAAT